MPTSCDTERVINHNRDKYLSGYHNNGMVKGAELIEGSILADRNVPNEPTAARFRQSCKLVDTILKYNQSWTWTVHVMFVPWPLGGRVPLQIELGQTELEVFPECPLVSRHGATHAIHITHSTWQCVAKDMLPHTAQSSWRRVPL